MILFKNKKTLLSSKNTPLGNYITMAGNEQEDDKSSTLNDVKTIC